MPRVFDVAPKVDVELVASFRDPAQLPYVKQRRIGSLSPNSSTNRPKSIQSKSLSEERKKRRRTSSHCDSKPTDSHPWLLIVQGATMPTPDLNDFDDPLGSHAQRQPALSGNIGSSSSSRPLNEGLLTSSVPGEDRTASQSTIDESVWDTLRRDLFAVWAKLREVLYPRYLLGGTMFDGENGLRGAYSSIRGAGITGTREELTGLASRVMDAEALLQSNMSPGLRDWDLWGPLIFCLLLSLLLSFTARADQKDAVFSGVFAMVWLGEAVVTLQINSFAQSVCIIGYTLFPLVLAAMMSALGLHWIARIPVYLVLIAWSLAAGVSILGGSGVVKNRVAIAVYPLLVFYLGLGCLCFIS
ncbi:yip1 domain-containing protein [Sarocladium implicatum]|nr:yip1 domain-containing protein [Sarocladium implicatum]